ncbi:SDR family oxidoreductase [Cellulomonas sp. URHD0024]|uniref:SDR family oxidoreductase n=1 Tax=Cellulomonas sp. URHD0024 TaxID=1302620 RepID=UPI000408CB0E|nr:SDR family oxidoreductase [Cellulomonas sp. URHD0024]
MSDLVTGATGFVGSALILELLAADPNREVVCVARPRRGRSAADRVHAQLHAAVDAYASPLSTDDLRSRIRVVEGDLDVLPDLPSDVERVWHTAASLKFEDRDRAEIEAINVAAVERLTAWVTAHGVRALNHVSTAYTVGQFDGVVREEFHDDSPVNNVYEESKRAGERVVRDSGLEWRIMRPSIVVGHSVTRRALSTSGLYGFCGKLEAFRDKVAETFGDLYSNVPLHLMSKPDAGADFVPIDLCVRAMVHAGLERDPGTITHLANRSAPRMASVLAAVFTASDLLPPVMVDEPGMLSVIDRTLDERIDFYAPYVRQDKSFHQQDAVVGDLTAHELDPAALSHLVDEYHARTRRPRAQPASSKDYVNV